MDIKVDDIVYEIDLDFKNKSHGNPVIAKQYDQNTIWIVATLWDGGSLYEVPPDYGAVFCATKPDGNELANTAYIENGKIYYKITQQTTTKDGSFYAEFRLYKQVDNLDGTTTAKKLTTSSFKILIEKAAASDQVIESTSEFNALTEALALVGTISGKLDKTGDLKDTVISFTESTTDSDAVSEEKTSTIIGKFVKSIKTFRTNIGVLTSLLTDAKSNIVNAINELFNKIGNLNNLQTTANTDLVSSINEVHTQLDENTTELNSRCLNVRNYTNIQATIDALPVNGGIIYIPAGTYEFATTLTFPSDKVITFKGAGSGATVLKYTGSGTAINAVGSSATRKYVKFQNFKLSGMLAQANTNGFDVGYNMPGADFMNDVMIDSFYNNIEVKADLWNVTFLNVRSVLATNASFTYSTGVILNNLRFIGGEFMQSPINMKLSGRNNLIEGTDLSNATDTQLYLSYCWGITINSPYFEGACNYGIKMENCRGVVINGIDFSAWGNLETLVFGFNSNGITINGFICEAGDGNTSALAGKAMYFEGCNGVKINSPDIRNIVSGIDMKNSKLEIIDPRFSYVTTKIITFNHTSANLKLRMLSTDYAGCSFGSASLPYIKFDFSDLPTYGVTSARPTEAYVYGYQFYDFTLKMPIYWDDATNTWKKSDGTTA
jgi:hypothetical protein